MSFNREIDAGMLIEELRVGLDGSALIAADVGLVIVKINILHGLPEQVFLRSRGSRSHRRRRLCDSESRGGLLSSARAFGYQVIGGRIGGSDLVRSAGLKRPPDINGHIAGNVSV